MIFTGISWPDQHVQIAQRTAVHLRSRHEALHAHVDRKAALHSAQHMAGNNELILKCFFEIVPHAQAGRFLVGQQNIALDRRAVIDDHIHHIAGLHGHLAIGTGELDCGHGTL